MKTLTGSIDADDGALVRVEIGINQTRRRQLQQMHRPIPSAVGFTALIDTGADVSCVDARVLKAVALPVNLSFLLINAPGLGVATSYRPAYDSELTILHPSGQVIDHGVVSDLLVVEVTLPTAFDILIGRDVLRYCELHYAGPNNMFSLSYP